MIDEFLNKTDLTRIRVIAGDIAEGTWQLQGMMLTMPGGLGTQVIEPIDLKKTVKTIELKDQIQRDSIEPLVGAGVGALIGLRMFGPIGAAAGGVAGHFLTKPRTEVSVKFELIDGRKFIAAMHPQTYHTLKSSV